MPIYGYTCSQCGHQLEAFQKMSDPPLGTCPECQGTLEKQLYPVGVLFKGSGFYTTDYKGSKKDGGEAKNGSAESSKAETSSSTSSDSSASSTAE